MSRATPDANPYPFPPWAVRSLCHEREGSHASKPIPHRRGSVLTDGRALLFFRGISAPAHCPPKDGWLNRKSIARYLAEATKAGTQVQTKELIAFLGSACEMKRRPKRTKCNRCRCGWDRIRECPTCEGTGDGKEWHAWERHLPVTILGVAVDSRLVGHYLSAAVRVHNPETIRLVNGEEILSIVAPQWTLVIMGLRSLEPSRSFPWLGRAGAGGERA